MGNRFQSQLMHFTSLPFLHFLKKAENPAGASGCSSRDGRLCHLSPQSNPGEGLPASLTLLRYDVTDTAGLLEAKDLDHCHPCKNCILQMADEITREPHASSETSLGDPAEFLPSHHVASDCEVWLTLCCFVAEVKHDPQEV